MWVEGMRQDRRGRAGEQAQAGLGPMPGGPRRSVSSPVVVSIRLRSRAPGRRRVAGSRRRSVRPGASTPRVPRFLRCYPRLASEAPVQRQAPGLVHRCRDAAPSAYQAAARGGAQGQAKALETLMRLIARAPGHWARAAEHVSLCEGVISQQIDLDECPLVG